MGVCVCVIENLSRVFLSEWHYLHLWVMRVYIVWVKGNKVSFKNPPGKMFCDYLARKPYPQDIYKNNSLARLFSFQSCALYLDLGRSRMCLILQETLLKPCKSVQDSS